MNLHLLGSLKRKTTSEDNTSIQYMSELGCDFQYFNSRTVNEVLKKLSAGNLMFAYEIKQV